MAHYFSYIPNFKYINLLPEGKISDYVIVKNFFRRGTVRSQLFNNVLYFQKYSIVGDEKPYQVAEKFYGDSTLDWVIFLSNNVINIQDEWPLPSNVFEKIMIDKYGSYQNLYSGIHHRETTEVTDSLGNIILKEGLKISETWETNGNFVKVGNSYSFEFFDNGLGYNVSVPASEFVKEVTNYEYEIEVEDKKREIYVLKPIYLNILFNDIEEIMRYKKSSQYESPSLKRGDNIRLY